jgi:hypothetical protein
MGLGVKSFVRAGRRFVTAGLGRADPSSIRRSNLASVESYASNTRSGRSNLKTSLIPRITIFAALGNHGHIAEDGVGSPVRDAG